MAEGVTNNVYTLEGGDQETIGSPPPYPGTPNNFTRKMPPEDQASEQHQQHPHQTDTSMNEKMGPPPTFVAVPTSMSQGSVYYGPPQGQQYPATGNALDNSAVPVKKAKPTCGDITGLVLAVVACFLFFPLGIPALVLSCLAIRHRRNRTVTKAKKYTKISIILSVIGICLFVVIIAVSLSVSGGEGDSDDTTEGSGGFELTTDVDSRDFDPPDTNNDNAALEDTADIQALSGRDAREIQDDDCPGCRK